MFGTVSRRLLQRRLLADNLDSWLPADQWDVVADSVSAVRDACGAGSVANTALLIAGCRCCAGSAALPHHCDSGTSVMAAAVIAEAAYACDAVECVQLVAALRQCSCGANALLLEVWAAVLACLRDAGYAV